MASDNSTPQSPTDTEGSVTLHALRSGTLTLPLSRFIDPCPPSPSYSTVPSLSFLLEHRRTPSAEPTRVLFDLGIRRDPSSYPAPTRTHLETRQPYTTRPDVRDSLALGRLAPEDIDIVILSHVHWDHVGTPSDFQRALFVLGNGAVGLLEDQVDGVEKEGHAHFEKGLLPLERVLELPSTPTPTRSSASSTLPATGSTSKSPHKGAQAAQLARTHLNPAGLQPTYLSSVLPDAIDLFGTSLVYLIPSPGHLRGHVNLLARVAARKWIYLAADAAHDRRLLRGTHRIATWEGKGGGGARACIHEDVEAAEAVLERIRRLEAGEGVPRGGLGSLHGEGEGKGEVEVEVVFAHDVEWAGEERNQARFWPGRM